MCGIAGVVGLSADTATVDAMMKTMRRRGPDGTGTYQMPNCTLLHSRLAVIDPERGKQPMILNWGQDRLVLIYNGELYNTDELRQSLIGKGHHFMTHSDSEVVLHAYAEFGAECVEHMNGIFAFAVWEEREKRLFLARDRIGVKPLFYTLVNDGLIFASELKTVLCHPLVKTELDGEGAAQIILLGPGRMPGSGVFRGIREVEPGWRGYFSDNRLQLERYWYLKDRVHEADFKTTAGQVRELVLDAIKRQMVSDVPIGTFLSGGLDSSLITAVCAGEMAQKGERLSTFSVDYLDNDIYFQSNRFQPESDPEYIRLMRDTLACDHEWTVLSSEALSEVLEEATVARDLPGMGDVDFSLLAFCKEIRKKVTVALSGECADEIFGGYPWYRDRAIRDADGFPWSQNLDQRLSLLHPQLRDRLNGRDFVMDTYRTTCRESDILPENTPEERRMKEMVNLNFRWFMQTLLDRKDRMSMNHSLEVRVPFCDYRIAEYLYAVPWEFKDYQGKEKGLLRYAMEGILPERVLWRKKSPYPKTFDPQYSLMMRQRMEQLLAQKDAPIFQIVDRNSLRNLFLEESPWPWYGQLMRTPQTMAYFLQMDFWLKQYHITVR